MESAPSGSLASRPLPARGGAVLTVDVEDWFDVNYRSWQRPADFQPARRVREMTRGVLDALAAHDRRGTFFILAAAARAEPELVRDIASAGHEIACHGWEHDLVYELSPDQFARALSDAKHLLEDQAGTAVLGYRAASWSITRPALWALDTIAAAGFRYDASLFPVENYLYGLADAPLRPSWLRTPSGAVLLEVPAPAVGFGRVRVPHGGGFYLRVLPLWAERWLQGARQRRGDPALIYLHPREMAHDRLSVPLGATERFIQEFGVDRVRRKLVRLFARYPWTTVRDAFATELSAPAPVF